MNIVGLVDKYKEFYIPTIFLDEAAKARQSVLFGKGGKTPEPPEEAMRRDPRTWWRNSFDTAPKQESGR